MRLGRLPLLCLLTGLTLGAQDATVGAQVTLAKPVMDLNGVGSWVRGRGATGFGFNAPFSLVQGQILMPRIDLLDLRQGPVAMVDSHTSLQLFTERAKVQILSAGADYAFALSGNWEGGTYLGLGLAIAEARFRNQTLVSTQPGVSAPATPWPASQNKKAIQYALSAGWVFTTHLALEFRFTESPFKGVGAPGTLVKAPVFGLSLRAQI